MRRQLAFTLDMAKESLQRRVTAARDLLIGTHASEACHGAFHGSGLRVVFPAFVRLPKGVSAYCNCLGPWTPRLILWMLNLRSPE